jgi:wyosine [tRNA(Phe)-imidazoG37] synthetase (radical SAM superfamily)
MLLFWNKEREHLKDKINEPETNSKNKTIRDLRRCINEFKKSYQTRTNLVKNENGDQLAEFHSILSSWKNFFYQLLNVQGVNVLGRLKYI